MIGPHGLFEDPQRLRQIGRSFSEPVLAPAIVPSSDERSGDVRVIGPKRLALDRQCTVVRRLGTAIIPRGLERIAEVVQDIGDLRMFATKRALLDAEGACQMCSGVLGTTGFDQSCTEVAQNSRYHEIVRTECGLSRARGASEEARSLI